MEVTERKRVVIEGAEPEINGGRFPIKRVVGGRVDVGANIYADGHDIVVANLLYRKGGKGKWNEVEMEPLGNDEWRASFRVESAGYYCYTFRGWVDHYLSWRHDIKKKYEAGQNIDVDLLVGAKLVEEAAGRAPEGQKKKLLEFAAEISKKEDPKKAFAAAVSGKLAALMKANPDKAWVTTYEKELRVWVDRPRALFSAWYEMFPRSCSTQLGRHGTFEDCERLLPEISEMGFDVLYFPPIHPIGKTNRKGKNNSVNVEPNDPGSPWAIGSEEGGHKSVHPELGTIDDFEKLLKKAAEYNLEIALDIAFQCSPDHPYVKEHPEWFRWRPDGSIQFAENPPKKYEDIIPINFETDDWRNLWEELKSVFIFWAEKGVRIFRVDNPHTKPFVFWQWVISEVRSKYPEAIFLSEAFTRPKIMYRLAKVGFTQSYTYFTWRNTKAELTEYVKELAESEVSEYFRPNFWTNTPDILSEVLQTGGKPAFVSRLVLASTLSPNFGIYGPAYELCVNEPAAPGKEEYLNSEKYELKMWDWNMPGNLRPIIKKLNFIRKKNAAFHELKNVSFCEADNDYIMAYLKKSADLTNFVLVVVNLDPFRSQSAKVEVPLNELGIAEDHTYIVRDVLNDVQYTWQGCENYVELGPESKMAHVFVVHTETHTEKDFDYF